MNHGLNDSEQAVIIEGTFHSFIIQGVSVALVFLGNLLLARWAGADAYGKYVHVFNWISILSVAAIGGREDLAIAEITKYKVNNRPWQIFSLVKTLNRHIFIASVLIGAIFLTTIFLVPVKTLHEYRFEFLIASAAIYFMAFLSVNQFVLQALNYIRLSQYVEKLVKPLLLIVFFVIARQWLFRLDSNLLIVIAELVLAICCILLAWLVWKKIKAFKATVPVGKSYPERESDGTVSGGLASERENLTKKTMYFFLITLFTLLVTKISMLILPYFAPQKDIGIFNVSFRFADLIVYPFALMHTVLPQLFARHTASEASYKQSLYSESTKLMMILSLPLAVLNILLGKWLLGWFGQEFVQGYPAMVFLSIAQFLYSLFGPANTILMMQNKERYSVICLFAYVIVLVIMNLLLMPVLGITGGALSMLISCLIYNIILSIQAYRLSGVISPFFSFLIPAKG
jgi:O-antigen/teichoic acid export membrane protein